MGAFPDVATLIPHEGPARFAEEVLEVREDGIDCAGRVPEASPLVREGRVPGFAALELAAQAAAAFEALRGAASNRTASPRIGYLVSLRDVRVEIPELPEGSRFVASVRRIGAARGLVLYEARVLHEGALCAAGTLGAFMTPQAESQGRDGS